MKPHERTTGGASLSRETAVAMTSYDFSRWQAEDLLYARPVDGDDGPTFAIHAADGTFLDYVDSLEEATLTAHHNEMVLARVH